MTDLFKFMRDGRVRRATLATFIAAETFFFFSVQGFMSGALSYISVALAVCVGVLFASAAPDSLATVAGLVFTAAADFCLVVLDPIRQIPGMIFFSLAQLAYAARLMLCPERRVKRVALHIVPRLTVFAILSALMLLVLGDKADVLAVLTMFYFANLTVSTALSFTGGSRLFATGLVLFILCDVFVGLGVLATDYLGAEPGSFLYEITHTGFNTAWLFYVPSQTLIASSLYKGGGCHI